jgi:hypothetical protein
MQKKCSANDRVGFNTALVGIFHTEYSKSKTANGKVGDYQVIDWKFKLLDLNKNNILEKNEYQGLKKIAKTVKFVILLGRLFSYCDIFRS